MVRFGIVAEGATDQIVIEGVIRARLADGPDEVHVVEVQPPARGTNQVAIAAGGWTLVFDFLRRGQYVPALQINDFLVIHVDTDVCEDIGFGVPRQASGSALSPVHLIACVVRRLEGLIDPAFYALHHQRFLFAIAVDEIECWLLPFLFESEPAKSAKTAGCLKAASDELRRKNRRALEKSGGKDYFSYADAVRTGVTRRTVSKQGPRNPSLAIFLEELDRKVTPAAAR